MSKNYMNDSQASEIVKYISDTMKLPVLGAGGGFAPIGTINFFDASIAPQGWLACDGSVVNIADYPELATYYASVHGASNFYGGDGTTTFAVPDLRGEFLRGTGTNSHSNQGSGANVGVHQDGTESMAVVNNPSNAIPTGFYSQSANKNYRNADSTKSETYNIIDYRGNTSGTDTGSYTYTLRPTNTSFLICVKATVAGDPNAHVYSTEEQVVGTTEDGEVIYEKTYKNLSISVPSTGWQEQALSISNMKSLIKCDLYHNADGGTYTSIYYPTEISIASGNYLGIRSNGLARTIVKIVLQYTKNQ